MVREIVVLFVVATNAIVLGGVIAHLAYRAYRRTRLATMKWFAVGFGLSTLGFLFGGGLHQIVGTEVLVGVLAQSSLTGIWFAVLAYSLYAEEPAGIDRPGDASGTEP